MDEPTQPLKDYKDGTILYKKEKMSNGKFLYSFRDPKAASEQEIGYVQQANKKNNFKAENYGGTGFFCGRALTITNPKLA